MSTATLFLMGMQKADNSDLAVQSGRMHDQDAFIHQLSHPACSESNTAMHAQLMV